MVQRRAARYTCNRSHNTSSVPEMLQTLSWPTLEKRRIRTRIIFLYKIIHHLVAIYPTNLLTQSDPRTIQFPQLFFQTNTNHERFLHIFIFSKNNSTMEPPTCSCSTMHYNRQFLKADPNICFRTTFQHLNKTLVLYIVLTYNVQYIKAKKKITSEIVSRLYLTVYINQTPRACGIVTSVPGTLSSVC